MVLLSLRSHCLQRSSTCCRLHTSPALRSEPGISNPAQYCRELVRKHDYESYLTSQLYPKRFQGGYFALRAFYIELATVREAVSQTTLGQARLMFWRDAMKDIYSDKPPRHPIALAIHEATRDNHLPLYHFNRIIEAREQELHNQTHLTLESMTSHAESTSSTFLYLLLAMLNLSSSTLAHAASHVGVAQSLTTFLRALPFHATKGVMVIPAEITSKHNVNQQEIFSKMESSHGLEDAVFELATVANDHLLTARDMFKESGGRVPPVAIPVFSAAIPVVSILSTLETVNFNVFDPSLQIRDWRLAWQVWRSYYKRTF
ncbi:isoprenoid synthase domain-containing protein [Suillus spraguei]|nr:isoprenoid synthase domain-containing protein [Suillus spraguei]